VKSSQEGWKDVDIEGSAPSPGTGGPARPTSPADVAPAGGGAALTWAEATAAWPRRSTGRSGPARATSRSRPRSTSGASPTSRRRSTRWCRRDPRGAHPVGGPTLHRHRSQ
jgi:hypothetical protein